MTPLYVYIAADCRVCERTLQIVAEARALRPDYPIELVELDQAGANRSALAIAVIGRRDAVNFVPLKAAERVAAGQIGPLGVTPSPPKAVRVNRL